MELYNEKFLYETEFVVLDIETTGFTIDKGGRIIEIGAVKVKDGEIIDKFSSFVNPLIKIPKKITELTNISNDDVKDAPVINNVLLDFYKFIGDKLIIAHNADFDWNRFLVPYFKKSGIIPKNNVLDSIVLSKKVFPKEKSHKLSVLCERLNIPVENHHRAIDDCIMTAKAYLKLIELSKEIGIISSQVNLFEDNDFVNIKPKEIEFKPVIKRVSYWELKNTKGKLQYSRQYIMFKNNNKVGNVFFDIINNCWNNKDYQGEIDFKIIEENVLKFLSLGSIEDFKKFRTS